MKKVISTAQAPAAIGPYSQAIVTGDLLFVSGQIPLDPATGAMAEGGIEAQTTRVLDNLKAIVEAAGTSLARAVKTTVYITNIGDFGKVNFNQRALGEVGHLDADPGGRIFRP